MKPTMMMSSRTRGEEEWLQSCGSRGHWNHRLPNRGQMGESCRCHRPRAVGGWRKPHHHRCLLLSAVWKLGLYATVQRVCHPPQTRA